MPVTMDVHLGHLMVNKYETEATPNYTDIINRGQWQMRIEYRLHYCRTFLPFSQLVCYKVIKNIPQDVAVYCLIAII